MINIPKKMTQTGLCEYLELRQEFLSREYNIDRPDPLAQSKDFISTMNSELKARGEAYSVQELQEMRRDLRIAYQTARKKGTDKQALSEYRSALARIDMLKCQAEVASRNNLDTIMQDESLDLYQRFSSARSMLLRKQSEELYLGEGQNKIDTLNLRVNKLLQNLAEKDYTLSAGEQRAYLSLQKEIEEVQKGIDRVTKPAIPTLSEKTNPTREDPWEIRVPPGYEDMIWSAPLEKKHKILSPVTKYILAGAAAIIGVCSLPNSVSWVDYSPGNYSPVAAYATPKESKTCVPEASPKEKIVLSPAPTRQEYTIVKGDTLWDLAEKFYGNPLKWRGLAKANDVKDPRRLRIGKVLTLDSRPTTEIAMR